MTTPGNPAHGRRALGAFAVLLIALTLPAGAQADAGAAAIKRCATPGGFMTGPFLAGQVKARGVSCEAARRQVKRWGRTENCVMPDGPNDRVCRAGEYRCVTRSVGYELSRARCTAGKRRAVGFSFGS